MDSFSSEEVDFEMPVDNGDKGLKDLCDNAFDGEKPVDNGDEGFKGLCENAFDGEMPVDNGDEGFKDLCDDAFDGEGFVLDEESEGQTGRLPKESIGQRPIFHKYAVHSEDDESSEDGVSANGDDVPIFEEEEST
eukprot:CAMPEP_0174368454 /NCGR_PEP_ID=MMETSP0811_2-20130205/89094_1 /TAXON_ID=73025 ORGANISM="Eutreptiella gymnastica-like, Strain CCMP1594" /NCGR_SAMPLE_ID=MMETSP0811_2 /ASSEMBLY_ACC=CAM_ASM_000667 /LENGTH=134 /DNA_ID=CAMNT_0015511959 /DNA_START=15 /DNA_END=415 /DNA_ORIENTATION=+